MIKVLFVCLGNICRSPMAEFVFKHMVAEKGLANQFFIDSAGTEYTSEDHSPMHYGAKSVLHENNVPFDEHYARRINQRDYIYFDYILAMENSNIRDIFTLIGPDKDHKIHLLSDFTNHPHDIRDPWYTGNFDESYWDIYEGCQAFLEYLKLS